MSTAATETNPGALPPREAPAPLTNLEQDASHVSDRPNDEPILCIDNIQGNILAGFNKDFQTFIFLRITDSALFKRWLEKQIPSIATVAEVLAFNRLFKAVRFRRRENVQTLQATWINIAFSATGIAQLRGNDEAQQFLDPSFKSGLLAQSASLNDPTDPAQEGAPQNWLFGGSADTDAHVALIVAGDDEDDLSTEIRRLENSIYGVSDSRESPRTVRSGASIIYKQHGATLPSPLTGHEHFGWLDGVSQPGIRRKISANNGDLLTLRQNPNDRAQGKPGQDCLYPGEFVFGYRRQDGSDQNTDPAAPTGPNAFAGPSWGDDGSYYVVRRLRQDVLGFHQWLEQNAKANDLEADELGAALIGRHPHGAPVISAPFDDVALGTDDCKNNYFDFQNKPNSGTKGDPSQCDSGTAPDADPGGHRCPFSAHIRKAYPRDDTDQSVPALREVTTQTHRLLRRGIPFGSPSLDKTTRDAEDAGDRGLLFAAYQTSIVGQFEFITKNWANNPNFKTAGTGPDPILGQASGNRSRTFVSGYTDDDGKFHDTSLTLSTDFVIPTGGGYFFAPSIDALYVLAGATNPRPACLNQHPAPPPQTPPPVPTVQLSRGKAVLMSQYLTIPTKIASSQTTT